MKSISAASKLVELVSGVNSKKSRFSGVMNRVLGSSIKFKIGPITIEPASSIESGRGKEIVDLKQFINDAIKELSKNGNNFYLCFDRIDEIHKYDRITQERAVQGLFLVESELSQINALSVIVFIRTDLFEIYDIQEKNKLVSRTYYLKWNRENLLDFLFTRVTQSTNFPMLNSLMNEFPAFRRQLGLKAILPEAVEGLPVETWLWGSLANGNDDITPRQIMLLLVLASQSTSWRSRSEKHIFPIFDASVLIRALEELSELSFKELVDDFRVGRTFLANCRAGKIEQFGPEKVIELFNSDEGPISLQTHQLERLGFLERVLVENEENKKTPEFRVPKLYTRGWNLSPL